jgi:hypothetical protein
MHTPSPRPPPANAQLAACNVTPDPCSPVAVALAVALLDMLPVPVSLPVPLLVPVPLTDPAHAPNRPSARVLMRPTVPRHARAHRRLPMPRRITHPSPSQTRCHCLKPTRCRCPCRSPYPCRSRILRHTDTTTPSPACATPSHLTLPTTARTLTRRRQRTAGRQGRAGRQRGRCGQRGGGCACARLRARLRGRLRGGATGRQGGCRGHGAGGGARLRRRACVT